MDKPQIRQKSRFDFLTWMRGQPCYEQVFAVRREDIPMVFTDALKEAREGFFVMLTEDGVVVMPEDNDVRWGEVDWRGASKTVRRVRSEDGCTFG